MKRWIFYGKQAIRGPQLAAVVAAMTATGTLGSAQAYDHCDHCDGGIVCDSGCDSCGSAVHSVPVFKALDVFAGGIERLLGFDKCHSACDSGCDACDGAMMQELMVPMEPATSAPHHHYDDPVIPTVPPESYSQPAQPYMQPYPQPAPLPQSDSAPMPSEENGRRNDGSIFDTLSNPFSDDEVRSQPKIRSSIRPSSYNKRTIPVQALRPRAAYLHGSSTPVTHQRQPVDSVSLRPKSTNVQQAAARRPAVKATSVQRSNHQHTTLQQGVHPRQVQLSKAPTPKSHQSPVRKASGQHFSGSLGPTANPQRFVPVQ